MTAPHPKRRLLAGVALSASALVLAGNVVVASPGVAAELPAVEILGDRQPDEFPADALGGDRNLLTADRLLVTDSGGHGPVSIEIGGNSAFGYDSSMAEIGAAYAPMGVAPQLRPVARSDAGRITRGLDAVSFAERVLSAAPVYRTMSASTGDREHYLQVTSQDSAADVDPEMGPEGFAGTGKTYVLKPKGDSRELWFDASAGAWDQRLIVSNLQALLEQQWSAVGEANAFQLVNRIDGSCLTAGADAPEPATCALPGDDARDAQLWRTSGDSIESVSDGRRVATDGTTTGNTGIVLGAASDLSPTTEWTWTPVTNLDTQIPTSWSFPTHMLHGEPNYTPGYDIAIGDVDGIVGDDGITHDEAVVAYFDPSGVLTVAVLDYHSDEGGLTVTQVRDTSLLASYRMGVTVDLGDVDGDGISEIVLTHQWGDTAFRASVMEYGTDRDGVRELTTVSANVDLELGLHVQQYRQYTPADRGTAAFADAALEDFDGDGVVELVVTGQNYDLRPTAWFMNLGWDGGLVRESLRAIVLDDNPFGNGYDSNQTAPERGWSSQSGIATGMLLPPEQLALGTSGGFRELIENSGMHLATVYRGAVWDVVVGITTMNRQTGAPDYVTFGAKDLDNDQWVSLAAGSFARGSGAEATTQSLVLFWGQQGQGVWGAPMSYDSGGTFTFSPQRLYPMTGVYSNLTAYDRLGDSVLLGEPTVFTVDDYTSVGMIGGQPPTHADWLDGEFVNITRGESFVAQLGSSDSVSFVNGVSSSASTTQDFGGSLTLGEELTIGPIISQAKLSAEATAALDAKSSSLNEATRDITYDATGTLDQKTTNDDIVNVTVQDFRVYRYPVYDPATWGTVDPAVGCDEACYPFWDVTVPGEPYVINGGGRGLDFFDPGWQNGNALSYPKTASGKVPLDQLGSYSYTDETGATVSVREPLTNDYFLVGGVEATQRLDVSQGTNTTNSETSTQDWSGSAALKANGSLKLGSNLFTGGVEFSGEFNGSVNWNQIMTDTVTGTVNNSHGDSFQLDIPSVDDSKGYGFAAAYYFGADGTPRVSYATDVTGSAQSRQWWSQHYGQKPDPSLNLPNAIEMVLSERDVRTVPTWSVLPGRQSIRGFIARQPDSSDPVTSGVPYAAAPTEGQPVVFDVPVHNYSLVDLREELAVDFYAVPVDGSDVEVRGEPQYIGRSITTRIDAQSSVLVSSPEWEAEWMRQPGTGGAAFGPQNWRIFAVLDPEGEIDEVHELEGEACPADSTQDGSALIDPMTGQTETLACGQNNQGYGLVTVQPDVQGQTSVRATTAAAAAVSDGAQLTGAALITGARDIQVMNSTSAIPTMDAGDSARVLVRARSNEANGAHRMVLVYDGDPANGNIVATTTMQGVYGGENSATGFLFTPERAGMHELHVVMRGVGVSPDQEQILRINVAEVDTEAPGGGDGENPGGDTGNDGDAGDGGPGGDDTDAGAGDTPAGDLANSGGPGIASALAIAAVAAAAIILGGWMIRRRRSAQGPTAG